MTGSSEAFLEWARTSAIPSPNLAAFGRLIGDATVVGLSEAVHGAAQLLDLRNQLFTYLVEQKGFTAIAIESGLVEGRLIHDFVRGGGEYLATAVADGISWNMNQLPQNLELVQWLRNYNAKPGAPRKVNFYGFDVPGSPGVNARQNAATALNATLIFLTHVDPAAAHTFRERLTPLLPNLRFDFHRAPESPGYDRLCVSDRDALTAIVADVITLIERNRAAYMARGSATDYEWAYRAAIGARQVDAFLRPVPVGWEPSNGPNRYPLKQADFIAVASDARDRAQADNLRWIIEREGPQGKVLVFSHRYHLSAAPVRASWTGPDQQAVMGTYLRRLVGNRLVLFGNLVGAGEICCGDFAAKVERAASDSMDGLAGAVGTSTFLLDLRTAPPAMKEWLRRSISLGHGAHGGAQEVLELAVGEAFDVLLYQDTLSPAQRSAS